MLPEPSQDRSALRWIRGELDQSLREARTQLEEFAEGAKVRGSTEALSVCTRSMVRWKWSKCSAARCSPTKWSSSRRR